MARYDNEHTDDRNHYGDWRDAHEGRHLPRDLDDDSAHFDSQWRGRHRSDTDWRETSSYDASRERGWRDEDDRRYGSHGDRGFAEQRPQGEPFSHVRPRGADPMHPMDRPDRDMERDYGRTVSWDARRHDEPDRYGSGDRHRDVDYGSRALHSGMGWSHTEAWNASGPFVGRGPRGYQRSDERIREDICERLTQDGYLDATDIEVEVQGAQVTLRGSVDGRRSKRRAEDMADEVSGVRDVRNELRVNQASGDKSRRDYAIADSSYQTMDSRSGFSSASAGRASTSPTQERMAAGGESSKRGFQPEVGPGDVQERMQVVGRDGDVIGEVREVAGSSFLVDRPMHRDTYIPFGAVSSVSGNRVTLRYQADDIDDQGWATPELMETGSNRPDSR